MYKEDWAVVLVLAVTALLIVGLAYFAVYSLTIGAERACRYTGETMEIEWRWEFWGGCFFEVEPGKWMPADAYIGLEHVER